MICTRNWIIYRISSKELQTEFKRQEYYDRIVEEFSKVIENKNELKGESKTANRCKRDGVLNGIRALMNRWFIFQELNGVIIKVLTLTIGKQG